MSCVKWEKDDDGIAWITYNRPEKRNAMNPALHYEMEESIVELETDDEAKVLVITGAGDAWSAGMDLREFFRATDNDPKERLRSTYAHRHWAHYVAWSNKPTIAMVNGYCFGGAFTSLAACDIVITAEEATYGLSEINWGILPGGNVSKVFADLANFRNAMFYAMTGRTFDGKQAVDMGIATLAVPMDRLREETVAVARELMEKAPVVLAHTKHSYEYLATKGIAMRALDPERTRAKGMEEFLDKKTYRPGLGAVKRSD
jgi:trans-feruloyl-CoA hydratase/vanillin synthase